MIHVGVKSVNHRHLDLQIRVPPGWEAVEAELRRVVKGGVRRGHVEVTLTVERVAEQTATVQVNEALLEGYVQAYRGAATRLGLAGEPDLHALLRMPGVVSVGVPGAALPGFEEQAAPEVARVAEAALEGLHAARRGEGAVLVEELRRGMEKLGVLAAEAGSLRKGIATVHFERLRARMRELLEGQEVEESRLLTEAALLAERGDVEEELVRLRAHVERFLGLLDAGDELGRPLDFLLQELNREVNTTLSKTGGSTGDAGLRITEIGLAMKTEVERAREQVQNLE